MKRGIALFAFLLLIVLVLIMTNLSDCADYCRKQGYKLGNCLDCSSIGESTNPDCSSENFFYDDKTWELCTDVKLEDNVRHGCYCAD
ncbi:hypothetical protein KY330_05155 [Candidatus Woesearchaeota archaeon]|nr:hypothetical protein [Candidatus Woesearchaeota archaeon]